MTINRIAEAVALALIYGSTALSAELEGWGRLKWGATKAQVLREYVSEKARLAAGGIIIIPEYKIASDSFAVNLSFDASGLYAVVLYPLGGDPVMGLDASAKEIDRAMQQGKMAFRVRELLTLKYGKPGTSNG